MLQNDRSAWRARQIDVLEMLRTLLREIELSKTLSTSLLEQVQEARLRTDREIEALRNV